MCAARQAASGLFLLHPAVAHAGRELDRELHDDTVRAMYVIWNHHYQQARMSPAPASLPWLP